MQIPCVFVLLDGVVVAKQSLTERTLSSILRVRTACSKEYLVEESEYAVAQAMQSASGSTPVSSCQTQSCRVPALEPRAERTGPPSTVSLFISHTGHTFLS
jgi:hypothetical protein